MPIEPSDLPERMTALALTFPSLRDARGMHPWNCLEFDDWASDGQNEQVLHSARFILNLWMPAYLTMTNDWHCGRFCVFEAMLSWDEAHTKAFLAWVNNPWWP